MYDKGRLLLLASKKETTRASLKLLNTNFKAAMLQNGLFVRAIQDGCKIALIMLKLLHSLHAFLDEMRRCANLVSSSSGTPEPLLLKKLLSGCPFAGLHHQHPLDTVLGIIRHSIPIVTCDSHSKSKLAKAGVLATS